MAPSARNVSHKGTQQSKPKGKTRRPSTASSTRRDRRPNKKASRNQGGKGDKSEGGDHSGQGSLTAYAVIGVVALMALVGIVGVIVYFTSSSPGQEKGQQRAAIQSHGSRAEVSKDLTPDQRPYEGPSEKARSHSARTRAAKDSEDPVKDCGLRREWGSDHSNKTKYDGDESEEAQGRAMKGRIYYGDKVCGRIAGEDRDQLLLQSPFFSSYSKALHRSSPMD